ncbi:MAG: IS6 family transposase [Gemmatimonadota bacterium]|nr:MAG: IS6 family transposase [Gemmatimonadota bacterium]
MNRGTYRGYRFPPEVISHGVWLYHRCCLSLRDVEEMLAKRGILVTYETIRHWCRTFGPEYAHKLKRRQGRLGDRWHLDEVFVKINGTAHRNVMPAVDHNTERYANNLAEVSHQPTRQRERQMRRFKSAGQAQRFLSVHGVILNFFRFSRHRMRSENYRWLRARAFKDWNAATAA